MHRFALAMIASLRTPVTEMGRGWSAIGARMGRIIMSWPWPAMLHSAHHNR